MAMLCAFFAFLKKMKLILRWYCPLGEVGARVDGYLPFLLIIGVIGAAANFYAYGHIRECYECCFPC